MKREKIAYEYGEDLLFADGFDDAIIGVDAAGYRVVYDHDKMVKIMVRGGMDHTEAVEYIDFNVIGAFVGDKTPIYVYKVN